MHALNSERAHRHRCAQEAQRLRFEDTKHFRFLIGRNNMAQTGTRRVPEIRHSKPFVMPHSIATSCNVENVVPIPRFNGNLVLPPHLGKPANIDERSPYPCDTLELCQQFGGSEKRAYILMGLMALRKDMAEAGIRDGFQWLDGSFLEDVEQTLGRPPHDIDVVTFYQSDGPEADEAVVRRLPVLAKFGATKRAYSVDHYLVAMNWDPESTVVLTAYWYGLFSHRRDGIWKGMLRIELGTQDADRSAMSLLAERVDKLGGNR